MTQQSKPQTQTWSISHKPLHSVFTNTYTQAQYLPYIVPKDNPFLGELRRRQSFQLAHLPKIVELGDCEQMGMERREVVLLVEQGRSWGIQGVVSRWRSMGRSMVELVFDIVRTAAMLYRWYGAFLFTNSMIKATQDSSFIMWVHEKFSQNYPQYKTESLQQMMESLIEVLRKAMPTLKIVKQLSQSVKNYTSFECILHDIKKEMCSANFRRPKSVLAPKFLSKKYDRPLPYEFIPMIFCESIVYEAEAQDEEEEEESRRAQSRKSVNSNSTASQNENESLIERLRRNGRLVTLDTCLRLQKREILQSEIWPQSFDYYWNLGLAQELNRILDN